MIRLGTLSKALLAQVGAMGVVLLALNLGLLGNTPFIGWLVLMQSGIATIFAWLLKSDRWWLIIHAVFPVALALASRLQLDSAWYLAGFVVLLLVFGPTVRTRVPLYLSNQTTAAALTGFLKPHVFDLGPDPGAQKTVLDFGSGTGSMLKHLARDHPLHRFEGIEGAWLPYLVSRLACAGLSNVVIKQGDFWSKSLTPYCAVYAFLSTEPMPRLWEKAKREMTPGSFLISNSFQVPGQTPTKVICVDDARQTELFVYRL
ncbi:MAG: class I SAM-dependent methyltransferase [Burkholderiaceae bacterium]|nr:class I SAM-dependent methyltransferase [Burkholderiaceae bacterium]